jgi:subtilisin family serine protease
VLGVGAVGATGQREGYSQQGEFVDVMAPGAAVIAPAAGGGHVRENGTSFAAPFVSATAALIMQRFPGMRGQDVIRQITATADPAPGGRRSDAYGFGVLNPYRALTETVTTGAPKRALVLPVATADPAIAALRQRRAESRATAFRVAGAGLAVTVVVVLVALIVPNGRRRRWAPAGYRVR